jgi:hypothetical protein
MLPAVRALALLTLLGLAAAPPTGAQADLFPAYDDCVETASDALACRPWLLRDIVAPGSSSLPDFRGHDTLADGALTITTDGCRWTYDCDALDQTCTWQDVPLTITWDPSGDAPADGHARLGLDDVVGGVTAEECRRIEGFRSQIPCTITAARVECTMDFDEAPAACQDSGASECLITPDCGGEDLWQQGSVTLAFDSSGRLTGTQTRTSSWCDASSYPVYDETTSAAEGQFHPRSRTLLGRTSSLLGPPLPDLEQQVVAYDACVETKADYATCAGILLPASPTAPGHFRQSMEMLAEGDLHVGAYNPGGPLQHSCDVPQTPAEISFLYAPDFWSDGALGLNIPALAACGSHDATAPTTGFGFSSCWVGDDHVSCQTAYDACIPPTGCWADFTAWTDGSFSVSGYSYTEVYDPQGGGYSHSTGFSFSMAGRILAYVPVDPQVPPLPPSPPLAAAVALPGLDWLQPAVPLALPVRLA